MKMVSTKTKILRNIKALLFLQFPSNGAIGT